MDETRLGTDERQYLAQRIDIQEFIEASAEFRKMTIALEKKKEWIQRRISHATQQWDDDLNDKSRETLFER